MLDILVDHVGHSIEVRDTIVDDAITGVRVICRTCGYQLIIEGDISEPIALEPQPEPVEPWVDSGGWDSGQIVAATPVVPATPVPVSAGLEI
jgi:hypothetical protein